MKASRIAVGLIVFAACSRSSEDTPERALSAWVSAMNVSRTDVGARHRAFDLLSNAAQSALRERAARASQLSGREIPAWEMLAPGRFAMRFAYDPDAVSVRVDGDRAVVTARGTGGEADVPMVREDGHWHVDLHLPPMQSMQAPRDGGT